MDKKGFVLGEGSVSLILEKDESCEKRGAKKYAELAGYGMAHRSVEFGTISGSESALKDAVLAACADAGITPDDISAVCAFADGHSTVDALELSVYKDIFAKDMPLFFVKEDMGEARAAASAKQAAFAAGLLSGGIKSAQGYMLRSGERAEVSADGMQYVLAAGFGVGGSYSAVILKRA